MKEQVQSDQLLSTSRRSRAGEVWTEENTRRLLQAASTVPEPDEALLLRVERRLQIAAEGHSYAAQSARRALVLRGVILAYLFCLIASASLGFQARHAIHRPPVSDSRPVTQFIDPGRYSVPVTQFIDPGRYSVPTIKTQHGSQREIPTQKH